MLVLNENNIEALIKAGLTLMQSKVYLALIDLGHARISEISKISQIDRSNIYKLLRDLEDLELIEKDVGRHTSYCPLPLEIALSILINRKKLEYNETVKALEKMARTSNKIYADNIEHKKEDYFKIYPAGSHVFCKKWETTLKEVKQSVDLIATEQREPKDDPIWRIYESLLKKGVKVRWIIDRSTGDNQEFSLRVKQFQHLFVYPNIEMRSCYNCPQPYGVICDNNLAIVMLCKNPPVKVAKSFWTNNEQILQNFREHFEINWEKGIPYGVKINLNPSIPKSK